MNRAGEAEGDGTIDVELAADDHARSDGVARQREAAASQDELAAVEAGRRKRRGRQNHLKPGRLRLPQGFCDDGERGAGCLPRSLRKRSQGFDEWRHAGALGGARKDRATDPAADRAARAL